MRPRPSVPRLVAVACALALATAACSIQAPDVSLVGEGGGDGGGQNVAGPAEGGGSGSQRFGGGSTGGQRIGGGGGPAGDACLGKATDTGVTGKEIKLGANFAASGPVSNISGPILKGVTAYFNEVNAKGGVNGRKVKLKWYDDGWDAQKGKGLIKKLVEQDRVFVLTVVPSSNGLDAARSYLESRNMPVFGTSGLIESQFKSPMQWPVGTSTRSASRIALKYFKEIGVRNVAVIWLDLLAGREAWEATRDGIPSIFGKGAEEVLIGASHDGYRVSISEPDFAPKWAQIIEDTKAWQARYGRPGEKDGRPDFVTFAIDPTNAIKALQAAENIELKPKLGWGGGAPLFLDLVWQQASYASKTGLLAGTSFHPPIPEVASKVPAVNDYINAVRKYYGGNVDLNNPYLEGGYAGAALTVEIIKRVGPCLTRAKAIEVGNSLSNYSAAGLTQPLNFKTGNHYGNIYGLTVQVTPDRKWRVARDWVADPTPGK